MNYTPLSRDERYPIAILRKAGHKQSDIAGIMNRHPATISRELGRNRGQRGHWLKIVSNQVFLCGRCGSRCFPPFSAPDTRLKIQRGESASPA